MIGICQIKVSGEEVPIGRQLTLEEAQELVSTGTKRGFVEAVQVVGQAKYSLTDICMLVHEEGVLQDLPFNPVASHMAGQPIVGDVLIVQWEQSDLE